MKKTLLLTILLSFSSVFALTGPTLDLGLDRDMIHKITIEGNRKVTTADIYFSIDIKPGSKIDGEAIQKSVNTIYQMGYFYDVGASLRDLDGGKELIFKVVENEVVEKIEIQGNSIIPIETMLDLMDTKAGQVFRAPVLNEDIKKIGELYSERGYILSSVTDAEVLERGRIIKLTCTEGMLESIKLEGNEITKDWVILREFSIKPGEIYSDRKVKRSLQNVFNLGYFENVSRKHEPGITPGGVILVVELKEQKTGSAGIGGTYSASKKFVGFVEIAKSNFRGLGQKIKFKFEFGDETNYQLGFFEPWLNGKPLSFGVDVYKTKSTDYLYDNSGNIIDDYEKSVTGGSLLLGKKFSSFTSGSIRFSDESIKIKPESLGLVGGRYQSLLMAVSRDTRDSPVNPTGGLFDTITVDTTGGVLKGPNAFTKYMVDLRRFYSVSHKDVIALRSVYGFIDVSKGTLPIYHEWGIGGAYTLRGYRLREFTGVEMLVLNAEFRHTFNRTLEGVLFYDAGDTNSKKVGTFSLKKGYGVGLNLKTPIGLIRLDWGKGEGDRESRTYFSMGKMY